MTWEETIRYIRTQPEYKDLVALAYFEEDLKLNVERFRKSEEYKETLTIIEANCLNARSILDIGSGNGISAIAFALDGFDVTVSEPDPSETIGAGAIRQLKQHYGISNMRIFEQYAEDIAVDEQFDIVYVRQAMHHAYDLNQFIKNLAGLIKPGGYLLTTRDHVIYNEHDKQWFLGHHPLQKFYGGENAFTSAQYREAMNLAGLSIVHEYKHYDSIINYFPQTRKEVADAALQEIQRVRHQLKKKLGRLSKVPGLLSLYLKYKLPVITTPDESKIPGRMYSYLAKRKR